MIFLSKYWCLVAIILISTSYSNADDPCRYTGTKGVIDLSSIGNNDGTAKFSDISPGVTSNYSELKLVFISSLLYIQLCTIYRIQLQSL